MLECFYVLYKRKDVIHIDILLFQIVIYYLFPKNRQPCLSVMVYTVKMKSNRKSLLTFPGTENEFIVPATS